MKNLEKIIGEAIGEASMLWELIPTGVFEAEEGCELIERTTSAIRAELNKMIVGKKDIVPNYSKGSDGYELKLLQLGYNQALSDIQKEIG